MLSHNHVGDKNRHQDRVDQGDPKYELSADGLGPNMLYPTIHPIVYLFVLDGSNHFVEGFQEAYDGVVGVVGGDLEAGEFHGFE